MANIILVRDYSSKEAGLGFLCLKAYCCGNGRRELELEYLRKRVRGRIWIYTRPLTAEKTKIVNKPAGEEFKRLQLQKICESLGKW